ncbi:MAG TPA: formate/nitrite transporter family protein [Candidatus Sulfotelmatobacter sp.]|jgi:formate/nitrite transporter FocA (FNT family)|nr:formate/nitrite transporter family protein [Candidatus Sulfotelmatobacter sp.]
MPASSKAAQEIVEDPESPVSNLEEAKKVKERVALGAHVVYEAVRLEGEDELERPAVALAWSGLAAGLSMGFSLLAEAALFSFLPDRPWRLLVSHAGYSVGFLVVILGRQQLFTENTLTVVLPLLLHKDLETLKKVLRLWTIVLSTNVAGTFLFALTVGRLHFLQPGLQQGMLEISQAHIGPGFWTVFMRAVFAGWLIALMVWMLPNAGSSRVATILIITFLISIASLSHVIAGSANVFFLVVSGHLSLGSYFTQFFVPTLFGNIFGGVSLVAALAHGQVVGGKK